MHEKKHTINSSYSHPSNPYSHMPCTHPLLHPGPCMLRPAVLVNFSIALLLSYPFRSSLTNPTRQKDKRAEDPSACFLITLLLPPSLHAIMHMEIIRPFQRRRHVQEHHSHPIRPNRFTRRVPAPAPDRPLEARECRDVILIPYSLVAWSSNVATHIPLPIGRLSPSASCRALLQCSWKPALGRAVSLRRGCGSERSSFCCDKVGTRTSSS